MSIGNQTGPKNPSRLTKAVTGFVVRRFVNFVQHEDGAMTYLSVMSALVMIAFGGIGIDMIHAELKRTQIQATMDRAVLAAADLDQTLDAQTVVNDYFDKMGLSDVVSDVRVQQGLNYKRVAVEGDTTMDARFARILGASHFDIGAASTAEEWVNNVEVSLVIDISGSMRNNNRLNNLRDAAEIFIDTVISDDFLDTTSITLVPYSEHVNAGPDITSHMNVDWMHGYSHCLEFPDSEFSSAALNTARTYEQMQHYQWNYYGGNDFEATVCPQYAYERISPFENDREVLRRQIRALQPRAGTSIFLGMKWGVAFLDPSTRRIANGLIADGVVDNTLSGRPYDYDFADTTKHVILMTDGQHDRSYRIQDWAYNSENDYKHWDDNNLWYFLQRQVSSSRDRSNYYTQKYTAEYGDALLDDICDAAKEQNIIIWTIAFENTAHGANVMRQCASSPAHYFNAQGTELSDVFYSIARSINQLKLTQ